MCTYLRGLDTDCIFYENILILCQLYCTPTILVLDKTSENMHEFVFFFFMNLIIFRIPKCKQYRIKIIYKFDFL